MKFVGFGYRVLAEIELTVSEIRCLCAAASAHYDAKCRAAANPGGFIDGWSCWSALCDLGPEPATFTLDTDQAQILCKILERVVAADPLNREFPNLLHRMLNEAERLRAS